MKYIIIQVLGKFDYNEVDYRVDEYSVVSKFSSVALANYLNDEGEIIFLAPSSLVFRKDFPGDRDRLVGLLQEDYMRFMSEYRRELEDSLKDFVGDDHADIRVEPVNSIGEYKFDDDRYVFKIYPDNLRIKLFRILYNIDSVDSLYVDISTGYNQYINLLMDAFRGFIVVKKLSGYSDYRLGTYYALCEPVSKETREARIYIQEYDVKAFIEWPFKDRHYSFPNIVLKDPVLKKNIGLKHKVFSRGLRGMLQDIEVFYKAVKHNIPLLLFRYPFKADRKIIDYEYINDSIDKIFYDFVDNVIRLSIPSISSTDGRIVIESNQLNYRYFLNVLISFALYQGLRNIFKIPLDTPTFEVAEDGKLKGDFKYIVDSYELLGFNLNARFLERDLREIWNYRDYVSSEWTSLKELMEEKEDNSKKESRAKAYYSDDKRNFFAHSGFLRQIVSVRRVDGRMEIKYNDDAFNLISKWIRNI